MIYASSVHAIGYHELESHIDANAPHRPDSLYGLSKCFVEDLGRLYWDKFGLESAHLRIFSSYPEPAERRMLWSWLSFDDCVRLVSAALTAPRLGHTIAFGMSNNKMKTVDNRLAGHISFYPRGFHRTLSRRRRSGEAAAGPEGAGDALSRRLVRRPRPSRRQGLRMQTALVTGATSGIGYAIAEALAASGRRVLALGRQADALQKLAASPNIVPLALDLLDRQALAHALADEPIDILFNNAGVMPPLTSFDEMSFEAIDSTVAINLTASLYLTRLVASGMRERRRGHIFFTGSTAGHSAFPKLAVYGATKAAIGAFADGLRLDMAPHGVRVTEIVAGRTETNLYKTVLSEDARAAMYAGGTAVQPKDIAAMALAVLALPETANVSRFDIAPTRQATPTGAANKGARMKNLDVVIVGGGAGLGALLAEMVVAEGAAGVGIIDLNAAAAETALEAARRAGLRAAFAAADISRGPDAHAAFADVAEKLGRVDTLVNSAAIYPRRPLLEITDADWDASNGVNVKGAYHMMVAAAHAMRKQPPRGPSGAGSSTSPPSTRSRRIRRTRITPRPRRRSSA